MLVHVVGAMLSASAGGVADFDFVNGFLKGDTMDLGGAIPYNGCGHMLTDDVHFFSICLGVSAGAGCVAIVLGDVGAMCVHGEPGVDGGNVHCAVVVRHAGSATKAWVGWGSKMDQGINLGVGLEGCIERSGLAVAFKANILATVLIMMWML